MFNGGIDSPEKVEKMIEWCRELDVRQLTLRRVAKPGDSENVEIFKWTENHLMSDGQIADIKQYLDKNGTLIDTGSGI
jgi:hypothetical protein